MRVLVYETSKDRAKLITDLLSSYRYKVFENYSDTASVKEIQEIKPSLIILNINHRAHVELLEKLKKHSRLSRIPVILISSLNSGEIMEKINQFPHVDFLVEPFKIKNFRHMVERWINFKSLYVN
jgi:response regulator RpfG family c-di-GMP phosphodiesterase